MRKERSPEDGMVSIAAAIFMVAMIGLFVAAMSYSQFLSGYTRAREAASDTARVGVQEIDPQRFRDTGEAKLDTFAAKQAMREHIKRYPNTQIIEWQVTPDRVDITIAETVKSISGRTRTLKSSASAEPVEDR